MKTADFNKNPDGLLPAIVQDAQTLKVLMLGYMNQEALEKTISSGKVTFFSRSKKRLWTKGEASGHHLAYVEGKLDCDTDTFLIYAQPKGPTCHTGADTCWGEKNESELSFIRELEATIAQRRKASSEKSYVAQLFQKGINKIAQKVGEEAVELVIEAMRTDLKDFKNEAADLLYHLLVLLNVKSIRFTDVEEVLKKRSLSKKTI